MGDVRSTAGVLTGIVGKQKQLKVGVGGWGGGVLQSVFS